MELPELPQRKRFWKKSGRTWAKAQKILMQLKEPSVIPRGWSTEKGGGGEKADGAPRGEPPRAL